MDILARHGDNQLTTVTVQPSDTIARVKERFEEDRGVAVGNQIIKLEGRELENALTVDECNITHGQALHFEERSKDDAKFTSNSNAVF